MGNAIVETMVYSIGIDFAFSVAHESMKSLVLSCFYIAIGVGVIVGSLIFMIFAKYMPFEQGNNPLYQSIVFLGITIANAVTFFCFADWTPVEEKTQGYETQQQSDF